jgi:hypothetical protein
MCGGKEFFVLGNWPLAIGFWLLAFGFWHVARAMVEAMEKKVSAKTRRDWRFPVPIMYQFVIDSLRRMR